MRLLYRRWEKKKEKKEEREEKKEETNKKRDRNKQSCAKYLQPTQDGR